MVKNLNKSKQLKIFFSLKLCLEVIGSHGHAMKMGTLTGRLGQPTIIDSDEL